MTAKIKHLDVAKVQTDKTGCYYCDVELNFMVQLQDNSATKEHIIPKSWGGVNTPLNYLLVCKKCNDTRGCMSLYKFKKITPLFTNSRYQNLKRYIDKLKLSITKPPPTIVVDGRYINGRGLSLKTIGKIELSDKKKQYKQSVSRLKSQRKQDNQFD